MRAAVKRVCPLFLLVAQGAVAELSATVDRTSITEVDLLTLTVRLSNETSSESPDFGDVEKDFAIVGQSGPNVSSRLFFSNGRQTSESHTEWSLTLRPRHKGKLAIPAIKVGSSSTRPMTIEVTEASAATIQRNNQFVFFDTSVDTKSTYVQGQIIYTVKLFYVDSISGDFPPPPPLKDAVIETIESEKRYESIVNNRRFYVLEKRYAIYPQKSGTLVIPREAFNGLRGRVSFFTTQERVAAVSQQHTIEVKPRPAAFTGEHWLPAKNVTLEESWTSKPHFKVGEPINRTLKLMADGVAASLLPPFGAPNIENAKTYQDPPTTENLPTDEGILASMSTTVGIVPTKAGKITLPEIRVPWWDTETNKMEVALIPAQTYDVAPSSGVTVSVPDSPVPAQQTIDAPSIPAVAELNPWIYATAVFAVLWLLTMWQWWIARGRLATNGFDYEPEPVQDLSIDEAHAFDNLSKACRSNDPTKARNALFLWGTAKYPNVHSLTSLARIANNELLSEEIRGLDAVLYSSDAAQIWHGAELLAVVNELRKAKPAKERRSALAKMLNPA